MSREQACETDEACLVAPDGWVIDRAAIDHLQAALAAAGSEVAGVAALGEPLPPGSSFRVHAERRALDGHAPSVPAADPVPGVVLLRPGTGHHVGSGGVHVDEGPVLVDPGARAHDPWAPIGPLEPARPEGRSPFNRRPLALFLSGTADPEPDRMDWARRATNGLLDRRVEARLATAAPTPGLYLTRPCTPSRASLDALLPDVIVALDDEGLEIATDWCADHRSATIVALDVDPTKTVELCSWRLGASSGHLRARIGEAVPLAKLAALVDRLCGAPQPGPPRRDGPPPQPVAIARTRARDAVELAVAGSSSHASSDRVDSFLRYVRAVGVTLHEVDGVDAGRVRAPLLLRTDPDALDSAAPIVEARLAAGLRTIVDLDDSTSDAAVELARLAGHAVVATSLELERLREAAVSARVLPNLVTAEELTVLPSAVQVAAGDPPTLAVMCGHATEPDELTLESVERLLADTPDLRVAWMGDASRAPASLDDRVDHWAAAPEPATLAACVAAVALDGATARHDELAPTVTRSVLLGVPMAFTRACAVDMSHALADLHGFTEEDDADRRARLLASIVANPSRLRRQQLRERAESLYGIVANHAVVRRLVGWMRHGSVTS